jgi:hypothetical protein
MAPPCPPLQQPCSHAPHDAHLHHELVDQLLHLRLSDAARLEVSLKIDVQEAAAATQQRQQRQQGGHTLQGVDNSKA